MNDELLFFSGIDGATGKAAIPSLSVTEMAQHIWEAEMGVPETQKNRLRNLHDKLNEETLELRFGFRGFEWDIPGVGWGVIYASDVPEEVKDEVQRLVDHRGAMRNRNGEPGYAPRIYDNIPPGQDADDFRRAQGQDFGVVDPDKMPYYLMIVGSPEALSFDFQHDLDAQHAVGRLYFGDAQGNYDSQGYKTYVDRLIAYEEADALDRERRAIFFSPAQDPLTEQNAEKLTKPLSEKIGGMYLTPPEEGPVHYQTEWYKEEATRVRLEELLTRSKQKPTFLFTANHGLFLGKDQPSQEKDMGAFLCQEWVGGAGEVPEAHYFSGRHIDLDEERFDLNGLVTISFACFSAGIPATEPLAQFHSDMPDQLAERPFISYLPQRMLARGGLAFIGHVGYAWSYSYAWPGMGILTGNMEDMVKITLSGLPVGFATDGLNQRYLDLHHTMTRPNGLLEQYGEERPVDKNLVAHWTARNDARGYVVLGDPAVRLRPNIMP